MAATYTRTWRTLVRMLDRKDKQTGQITRGTVARGRDSVIGEAFCYWLKDSGFEWKRGDQKRDHENACRRAFVAYHPHFVWWDNGWTEYERTEFRIERWEFDYDRRMVLPAEFFANSKRSTPVLWELDGSNEPIYPEANKHKYSERRWRKSINGKLDKYMRFFRGNPEVWAYVIFAVFNGRHGGKHGKPPKRANDICKLLMERGLTRGQFLVTTVDRLAADPLGPVYLKPTDKGIPVQISLRDV